MQTSDNTILITGGGAGIGLGLARRSMNSWTPSWPRIAAGEREVAYGFAEQSSRASRAQLDQMFERMNAPR